jgi:hypothetical protein
MPRSDGNLRHIFRERLPKAHWQSIETGAVGPGVPDSNYCLPGGAEGWIEFKQTAGWAVTLRPAQIGWLMRRSRAGGRVFVAVRQARPPEDMLWLALGGHAALLRDGGLKKAPVLGVWAGGPANWPWETVQGLLAAPAPTLAAPGPRLSPRGRTQG